MPHPGPRPRARGAGRPAETRPPLAGEPSRACRPDARARAGTPGSAWLRGPSAMLRQDGPARQCLGSPRSLYAGVSSHPGLPWHAQGGTGVDRRTGRWAAVGLALLGALGCGPEPTGGPTTVTVSGSVLGQEGLILRRQLERFDREHAEIQVEMRPTPDAADLRHQLYVQWLNARATDPDILQ